MESKEFNEKISSQLKYALKGLEKAYENSYNFSNLTRENIKKVEGVLESIVAILE